MRKRAALLAVLVMALTACAAAAEQNTQAGTGWEQFGQVFNMTAPTATPAPNAFRFRDGIRWGMAAEQVAALETTPMTERALQYWSVLMTDQKVVVSRVTADLIFMFREDRLMMISYEFQKGSQDQFDYLSKALTTVYGQKRESDAMTVKALMDAVNPDLYRADKITQVGSWTAQDGTMIYMYYFSANDFAITYVSPEQGTKIYQTNGL